jgi:hypothetical protein
MIEKDKNDDTLKMSFLYWWCDGSAEVNQPILDLKLVMWLNFAT